MKPTKPSLAERTASQIMDMIFVDQRFSAGGKLPNEQALADELGISRVTLREAIRILCARSVVEVQRGRGTFVCPKAEGEYGSSRADISMAVNVKATNRDMMEIRYMLEPMMAYYAAKRATPEDKERLRKLEEDIEAVVAIGGNRTKAEQDFHSALAIASHNPFLVELRPIINRALYSAITNFDEGPDFVENSLKDHRDLIHYIELGDASSAKAIMTLHALRVYEQARLDPEKK